MKSERESPQSSVCGFTQGCMYVCKSSMLTKGQIIHLDRKYVEIIERQNPERLSFRMW